jgi:hypothetical protein
MINLFKNITSADQSIQYLGQIFGNMSGILPVGDDVTIIGTMFRAFNSVVLAIGVLIIIYVTVVGVMQTAHEGEFMGKKFDSLWVPIRTVIGIAALIPTVSGFSAIQIVMMWVILQGVGAANFLWATALGAIDVLGSPYAQSKVDINPPTGGIKPNLQTLFAALACEATSQITAKDPTGTAAYYCQANPGDSSCKPNYTINPDKTTINFGPLEADTGACGAITYCDQKSECTDATSPSCFACKAQQQALGNILQIFSGIAQQFANADLEYRDFYVNSHDPDYKKPSWIAEYCSNHGIDDEACCVQPNDDNYKGKCNKSKLPPLNTGDNPADPANASSQAVAMYKETVLKSYFPGATTNKDFMDTVIEQYNETMKTAVASSVAARGSGTKPLSGTLEKAKNDGWLIAGSYYYTVAQTNNGLLQAALPVIKIQPANVLQSVLKTYRNNYGAASTLVGAASGSGGAGGQAMAEGASGVQSQGLGDIAQSFQMAASGGQMNPLAQMQIAGYTMLVVAQTMYLVLFGITLGLAIAGNINVFVFGNTITNPVGPGSILLYMLVIPAFYALLAALVGMGGLLAIYVPLIPFVIFAFGAIGWFIAVIETMVAGPIVALGILGPTGQHEFLGNAQPALMLLFNVFMRPSLMIFGLIAAMVLASVVVKFINYAFWGPVFFGLFSFGQPTQAGQTAGAVYAAVYNPLAFVIFLMAYVATIVAAVNKCFALIHILPQQVLSWIGGQGMPGGAETGAEALGEAKGAVTKGTGAISGGMTGSAEKAGAAGAKKWELKQPEQKAKLKAGKEATMKPKND